MYVRCQILFVANLAYALAAAASNIPLDCSSLAHSTFLQAHNASLLNTTHYSTGAFNASGNVNTIPFCEAHASISYGSNDSLIFALWLPDTQYSSRLMAIGNGGLAGVIEYGDMMAELNSGLGFAVVGGNAGHLSSDNDAGMGPSVGAPGIYQPFLHDEDQMQAWIHNAISIFTPAAKAVIKHYYGKAANYAYYRGCSAGGAQGFSLAEFHPDLFDGIIAGCSANHFTHLLLSFLWNAQHTSTNATFLPDAVLDSIQAKVIEQCDTIDGIEDNLIENPLACPFNISTLACTTNARTEKTTCLTPSQLSAVKALYQGPIRSDLPSTSIFPGLSFGSEAGWLVPQVQAGASNGFSVPILQNWVYQNLSYDPATFNWGSDVDFLDAHAGPFINAVNTNLSLFRKSGKKMIVYAGWADPNIAPLWSMKHFEAVTRNTIGNETLIVDNDFMKLVMVPGGGHCGLNTAKYPYVPAQYGVSTALVEWIEQGREPDEGIKSWGPTNGENRTRRLCTWPKIAKLREPWEVDNWESYTCG